jgi:hypothetical protein
MPSYRRVPPIEEVGTLVGALVKADAIEFTGVSIVGCVVTSGGRT